MKCSQCSFSNTPASRFCADCGTRLPSDPGDRSASETATLAGPEERFPTGTVIAGRYTVIEELGRGGMGAVYKVFDEAVREKVALKVIHPEIARRHANLARFRNELKLTRRISHRNVCRVFDLGEHGGLTYFTMEHISGENLRKIIRMTGPLAVATAIAYARQICRGLVEAHKLGVIHRDLKPHNVMIDPEGTAKIMDFGIARSPEGGDLTEPGVRLGTPRYMAPEQAAEGRADERSDVFALGLILYEMVTGGPPSRGDLSGPDVLLRSLPSTLPPEVASVILKCLEINPDRRYATSRDLLEALESLPAEGSAPHGETAAGAAGRARKRRVRRPALAVLRAAPAVLLLAVAAFLIFKPRPPRLSLAVLPFQVAIGEEDGMSPAEGLADNIRGKLSDLKPLRVISKISSEQVHTDPPDMALVHRRLGVDWVVTGAVTREDGSPQLDVFLAAADGSSPPRARRYRFEPERQFQTENVVVRDLAEALGVSVSDDAAKRFGLREPADPEAYRHFRWGESFLAKYRRTGSETDFEAALRSFEQAVERDGRYALAFWGLGNLYESRYVRSSEARDLILMLNHYEEAFRTNPELAEPHLGRGWALYYEQKFDRAYASFERALRIDPDNPDVNLNAGSFLRSLGLFREGLKFYEAAVRLNLDPLNTMPYRLMAGCHYSLGETAKTVEVLRRARDLDPSDAGLRLILARVHLLKRDIAEAKRELAAAERLGAGAGAVARIGIWLLAAEGRREDALRRIPEADYVFRYEVTNAYCLLGMNDEAVRNIALGVESGFRDLKDFLYTYPYLSGNPLYAGLRSRPDFAALLETQKTLHRERQEKFGGLKARGTG